MLKFIAYNDLFLEAGNDDIISWTGAGMVLILDCNSEIGAHAWS